MIRYLLSLVFILFSILSYAQTGPGGIGTTDGTSGLVLWLQGDAGVTTSGTEVTGWADQSGYGNDLEKRGNGDPGPELTADVFGTGLDAISFNGEEKYLKIDDNSTLDGFSDGVAIFLVMRFNGLNNQPAGILSKRNQSNNQDCYSVFTFNGGNRLNFDVATPGNDRLAGPSVSTGTNYILSNVYDGIRQYVSILSNTPSDRNATGSVDDQSSPLILGALNYDYASTSPNDRWLDADIAEIIIYGEALSQAQRIAVENYLANKYSTAVTLSANDYWSDDATYSNEIAGVGQESDYSSEATTATSGILTISESEDFEDDEFIFWGHNNASTGFSNPDVTNGMAREWLIEENGAIGDVTVSFKAADLVTGLAEPVINLLVDSNDDFSTATSYPMTLVGDSYEATVDLATGEYITVAFETPKPAGVSDALAFWFEAGSGVATSGAAVTTWSDLSGVAGDATAGTSPDYNTSQGINFRPVVEFDRGNSEFLNFDISGLANKPYTVLSIVERASDAASQYFLGSNNATGGFLYGYLDENQVYGGNRSGTGSSFSIAGVSDFDVPIQGPALVTLDYNSTNLSIDEYRAGTNASVTNPVIIDYDGSGTGTIGGARGSDYFDGKIAEVIAFPSNLSTDDYNGLVSQLAIKYGVNLGGDYTDIAATPLWDFSDNAGYQSGVVAIGYDAAFELDQRVSKSATDSLVIATSPDFTSANSDASRVQLGDGEYSFVSNNAGAFSLNTTYNGNPNVRSERVWRIRENNDPGVISVAIPISALDVNIMLVSNDPTFASGVTEVSLATSGAYVFANYNFSDGDYFAFVSDPSEIWYSYVSGDWNNPNSWTLDGAISALYINPDSKFPTAGDTVVIKSGRSITANVNNINITKLELIGTLDMQGSSGQNFTYIEGSGTMRLSGVGGQDNYPDGIDTLFYDSQEGGTVEYYGPDDIIINQTRNYNNLVINLDDGSDQLTFISGTDPLRDSIYVNGDFTVTRGIFSFNDDITTKDVVVQVLGDVLVEADGFIRVGTGNNNSRRHEFDLYGDFTNFGDARFTNRGSQSTGSTASNGIVDVNFLSDNQDQLVTLQDTTNFYRIEIDKGIDDTYVLDIQATLPSYFELYGSANQSHGATAQLTSNDNALGLIMGTVKLGENVDIGLLNTGGNYNISEGATLWINGGTASKTGGEAIVPYGKIRVTSGTLSANVRSGITSRGNGTLFVEGGTVNMNQFRTSVFGSTNQGGITQSGGTININGGNVSNNYYPLNLTYSGNLLNLSGGVLNVGGANYDDSDTPITGGGVFINSDPENISITGGTVNFISNDLDDFVITSRAPFYNLNLTKTSGTGGDFRVAGGNSGPNGDNEVIENLPLIIKNDFIIDNRDDNGLVFDANGNNLQITGSLSILENTSNDASVDLSDMTLIFEGVGSSSLDIGLTSTLVMDSLEINKDRSDIILDITNGQSTALQVDHYLNVVKGKFDIDTYDVDLKGALAIADTVGTALSTGRLTMTGAAAQSINSITGAVYDMQINNVNGVSLDGDFGVPGQLALDDGIFDIGIDKLTLSAQPTSTSGFSSIVMIQMAGNASDRGLSLYFDGNTADPPAVVYPIGTNANSVVRYTPATLDLSGIGDDGFVQIRVSDAELQTVDLTELAGNMLTYYWRVSNTGFSSPPTVESLTFATSDNDDPTGAPLGALPGVFVPGKVEDETPYLRSQEDVSDITGLIITFDGSGSGFPLENANYTAGDGTTDLFVGNPEVYYSKATNGNWTRWHAAANWTTNPDHLTGTASDYPQEGDIAVIGSVYPPPGATVGRHQFRLLAADTDISIAELIFDSQPNATALVVTDMSRVHVQDDRVLTVGKVSGIGELVQDVGTGRDAAFIGDLGEFVAERNNGFFYWFRDNSAVTISDRFEFPIVRSFGGGGTLDFSDDITAFGLLIDNSTTMSVTTNWTIDSLIQIGSNGQGTLEFPDLGTNVILECGTLVYSNNAGNNISVATTGTDIHRLIVNADIDLTDGTGFDLSSPSGAQVELEVAGTGDHEFINNTGVDADLYRLIVNKGMDTTSTYTINTDFTLSGGITATPQSLELLAGKLVLDNTDINIAVANNSNFHIPAGSGLEVTQGSITATNANIILDGLLRLNGSNASVTLSGSNVEYSNTGFALVDVIDGSLEVGNIFRRAVTTSTGILKYRQSGGSMLIASDGAPSNSPSRAAFEVINPGSEFTHSGGSFVIERGVTGDNNLSLLLEPDVYDLTGSTITLGNNNTPSYTGNFFNIKSAIPLNNLTINDDNNRFKDVRLRALPLTINGTLTIGPGEGFIANGFDVIFNGNLDNQGTFTNATANTILASTTTQDVDGGGVYNIFDLTKLGAGTASINDDLALTNNLNVLEGTLALGTNKIALRNDAYIESIVTNDAGSAGIEFNGVANQDLYGLSNQLVTLGTITINNAAGVDIVDGNGYNFALSKELVLNGGVFNIGGSLLTMRPGAPVTAGNMTQFSVANMVQTNSSFTDNGLKIEFNEVTQSPDTTIFFPVGEQKYTPVQFDINQGATAGSIRVRPANERHPTIVNNIEPGLNIDPFMGPNEDDLDDSTNVLQYYWIVVAEDVTNIDGEATFFYDPGDLSIDNVPDADQPTNVNGVNPGPNTNFTAANYISAKLVSTMTGETWVKEEPTLFDESNDKFTVPLDQGTGAVTFAEISGDYTAGIGSKDGATNNIEGAIPDELAEYISIGDGNFSDAANWMAISGPNVTDGVGPFGAKITIADGNEITMDISNVRLYTTEIEPLGRLIISSGSIGNRLGIVSGSGTIRLEDTELLPAGEYSDFLLCTGGGLEYAGSTDYSVLSGIPQIRTVLFEGSGNRVLPNNALTVCDSLIVNGPILSFASGQTYIIGDAENTDRMDIKAGTVTISNTSILDVNGDLLVTGGSFTGANNTTVRVFDDLTFSSGAINWNNSNVRFDGSTAQSLTGRFTGNASFDNLTIINTSATGVDLVGDMIVDGVLTLTDGHIYTSNGSLMSAGEDSLTLSSTGSYTGASASSHVKGAMIKNNVAFNSTYSFPVGKGSRYAPVSIANVQTGTDNWKAEYFTTNLRGAGSFDPVDPGSGYGALSSVSNDMWRVQSQGSNSAFIRLTYGPWHGSTDRANLRVTWWDTDGDARWENQGGIPTGTTNANGTIISENTIGFSPEDFALGAVSEDALPVEMLYFEGAEDRGVVDLDWATATEINNDYFEIQRSQDGRDWEVIGIVTGAGTTIEEQQYDFSDFRPYVGSSYYRLRQVDYDGQFAFTDIILVNVRLEPISFNVYPNPIQDVFTLDLKGINANEDAPYSIISLQGAYVGEGVLRADEAGRINAQLSLSYGQPAGIYILRVGTATREFRINLIKK